MSDEVARILSEMAATSGGDAGSSGEFFLDEATFDEAGYLRLNPDVAESIARGDVASGYQHFVLYGFREGRTLPGTPMEPRNQLVRPQLRSGEADLGPTSEIPFACEALIVSATGAIMLLGWVDDTLAPLKLIRIVSTQWRVVMDTSTMARIRRGDVENALGKPIVHRFGFIAFLYANERIEGGGKAKVELWLENGALLQMDVPVRQFGELELRNTLLSRLADADFHGNPLVERVACLDGGLGRQIVAFNRAITRRLVASPYSESFGKPMGRPRGSIVVCLYGKAEYQFAQNALYSGLPGIEEYEFIYVSNSPELGETLMREARIGSFIYGTRQTVMVLPGNAGFGAANNVALSMVRSDRILNVNPDVFPRDPDWAAKHTALVDGAPAEQTRLFGVPLYYDDGSLMHGGMFFEADDSISVVDGALNRRRLLRVEHYGKGAPPESQAFLRPRPVPAVTGAFISTDRAWFEQLGGFTEDFVFGHYEDADLCLKSLEAGTAPWLHDIRLWHFEGKGSTRLPPHEGGSAVNRWLFSQRWNEVVARSLSGPAPTHPLITGIPEMADDPFGLDDLEGIR
jgi:GT2 family glycosyltransferase